MNGGVVVAMVCEGALFLLPEAALVGIALAHTTQKAGGELVVFHAPVGGNEQLCRRLRYESLYHNVGA